MPLLHHLEELTVESCGSIEELFNIDLDRVSAIEKGSIILRKIYVRGCNKIANLFPCNPMTLLHHLEELHVKECDYIESLFNINLDCVGETGEAGGSSSLRSIDVEGLWNLREVWRIKGANHSRLPIDAFQAVERIRIAKCYSFRNVFSPATTNFDLGTLTYLNINKSGRIGRNYGLVESSQRQEIDICYTLFPSCLIHSFHNLRNLKLLSNQGMYVIFEIESTPESHDNQQRLFPYLEELDISFMDRITHVWKCNWNKFLILHQKKLEFPFQNLITIRVNYCPSIKYLFSPIMARLLSNLKKIIIFDCDGMEEVVSFRDDEDEENATSTYTHTSSTLFPHLDSLHLASLKNLRCIGGGNNKISFNRTTTTTAFLDQSEFPQVEGDSWTLCQYPRERYIRFCDALSSVIPCYVAGQMKKLQVLEIWSCYVLKEVFETEGINKSVITLKLPNLQKLYIRGCGLLDHMFTFSTLESLGQLEELKIENCKAMTVIVKEEHAYEEQTGKTSSKDVVFPRLKSIELEYIQELVGFFLGTNDFQWPSLDRVVIKGCPKMKVFTAGGSTAPQLKYNPHGPWFNSHVTTTTGQHDQETQFPSLESTSSSCPAASSSE